jgi:hypothetical protein
MACLPSRGDAYVDGRCGSIALRGSRRKGATEGCAVGLNSIRKTFDNLNRVAGQDDGASHLKCRSSSVFVERVVECFDNEPKPKRKLRTPLRGGTKISSQ